MQEDLDDAAIDAAPDGDGGRLSTVLAALSPSCGAEVQNLHDLYAGGVCAACLLPRGPRTDAPMVLRHTDGMSRRCDGVIAQLRERPKGPTYSLFSDRFLARLTDAERGCLTWRPVEVSNPTKTTRPLFELVAAAVHLAFVALRGGRPDRFSCAECGYESPPYYPLAALLPTWLNPTGAPGWRGQPSYFLGAGSLPEPLPALFSAGDARSGPVLVASDALQWPKTGSPGIKGIRRWPVGVVAPSLIDTAE